MAVVGRWVFVTDAGNTVYRYRADRVAAIFRGQRHPDTLDGAPAGTVVGTGFLTSDGQSLWAGTFNPNGLGVMHRYTVDGNGNLHAAGGNIEVPKKTQGLLVLPNYFVFSTSYGRTKRSNIYVVKRGYPNLVTSYRNGNLRCVRAPTMSEGVGDHGRPHLPALRVRSRLLPLRRARLRARRAHTGHHPPLLHAAHGARQGPAGPSALI